MSAVERIDFGTRVAGEKAEYLDEFVTKGQAMSFGDKYYVHDQVVASNVWNIEHGLGKNPSVVAVDSTGRVVYGGMEYINENVVKIYFKSEFSGKAYCV